MRSAIASSSTFNLQLSTAVLWLALVACESTPRSPVEPPAVTPNGFATAYGIWTPGPADTCTPQVHDAYSTVGPDGKLYPTWHPPTDPGTGCTFGHEHGRDPRGSRLYADVGDIPFGHANEQLDIYDPTRARHEDHVGHKIEWQNDIEMPFDGFTGSLLSIRCDLFTKLHQGTHSKDAFTNNLHEIVYHLRCSDGTEMHVTMLTAIGTPGSFHRACDPSVVISVGPATPPNSPSGGGQRRIPDRFCIEQFMLVPNGQRSSFGSALRENWETSNSVRTANGRTLAHFNPYYQVLFPSRYYDASRPNGVGRPIDACYEVEPNGDHAQGGECEASTAGGTLLSLAYDDPRSGFNGVLRFVDINSNDVHNAGGPWVWYSDPFGRNARTELFPGSVRQVIAPIDNERAVNPGGPAIGRDRNYGGLGVHAPN